MRWYFISIFASRLEEIMKIKNLKQKDLVKETGIAKSLISQYLSGKCIPKDDKLLKLSKFLNVDNKWLLGDESLIKATITPKTKSNIITGDDVIKYKDYIMNDNEIYELHLLECKRIKHELIEKVKKATPLQIDDLNYRFESLITLDNFDWKLLMLFNKLNVDGKKKALDYLKDLNKITDYYDIKDKF
ncbi:helix-turn-helix domain-containing protein [Clostridium botulinum]|uniref:helix-turn-helix domain-containing protein n=1 Tax=Clostridium botulinum TaxID=1491 RepID=UPI0013FA868E|nr:helix-turn-helix domain-containing protein [Clostridium botulinum]MBN1065393.1 helix-turn-helix domain-containing protein [Clostridium botulinum]NFO15636.1 helix-turn-helix domain-containing protein [Clostridium botulinum]